MGKSASRAGGWVGYALLVPLALAIGGFSLFVGYNKALAPLAVLAEHSAWTIHLPVLLGRALGWLEMLAAATLIASLALPRLATAGTAAAIWIALNHAIAAVVHVQHAETQTYRQSAVMIALCLVLIALCARRAKALNPRETSR